MSAKLMKSIGSTAPLAMAMVVTVGIVVADDAAIIEATELVVDIGQVIPLNLAGSRIDPHFPPELTIPAPVGQRVTVIDQLMYSHDLR